MTLRASLPSYITLLESRPTFVGFFVCGMMGRFGYEKDIIDVPHLISDLLGL